LAAVALQLDIEKALAKADFIHVLASFRTWRSKSLGFGPLFLGSGEKHLDADRGFQTIRVAVAAGAVAFTESRAEQTCRS
jgi:hypothetical protein